MNESADASRKISNDIHGLIVDLQFQDRNTQITENAVDLIRQCLVMFDAIMHKAQKIMVDGNDPCHREAVGDVVNALLSVIKLGDIRHKYASILQGNGTIPATSLNVVAASPNSNQDIELF